MKYAFILILICLWQVVKIYKEKWVGLENESFWIFLTSKLTTLEPMNK